MALVLRLRVGDAVMIGGARRWELHRVVAPNEVLELKGPEGQIVEITDTRSAEIEPDVFAFVGNTTDVARVVFRAPRNISIVLEARAEEKPRR